MCIKLSHRKFKIDAVNTCKLQYQLILKKFLDNLKYRELSDQYIYRNKQEITDFFEYLWSKNIYEISRITNEIIVKYIISLNHYSQATKYGKISKIRGFFKFMYLNNFTPMDLSLRVPKVRINHNAKIPHTIWSTTDITKILDSIDRTTSIGKRDFAIFVIMIYLGLRFSDIKNLKFENINWQMNTIHVI